ncbi:4-hydroxy-tetrahydrodipicolinate synthase [Burkholderia ubonensis]|uniref:4-hydroxy-tetrahydrodipicolinate synthase n=1 Tax=Burkholderia ubonensis subsp. mesacidophila TaxID=265293 RepID=A0A2A4FE54_9BURK|nr:4-hydroxy-tetrahydrodipicolinate synthase [Burkholderia ubonensis]PCE31425.1 4-hydroxy-tetrahydrodipicolinate synthase [Burkholderia ubonensis subsp. mesacidophila]
MQTRFEGIWLPLITPFHHGEVDHAALARLARRYAAAGIAGFVAGATTGEGALLDAREQDAVFATLRDAVPGLPIIVGLTASATQFAAARARELAALAPDGLLVTPPVYVRPTQDGIRRHFEVIVEAADRPVLVYNIPYRTGVNVELETLQALARDARVAGVKECGGSLDRMARLVHETPLAILSGDDNQNFAALCAGAHGTIASSAHVLTEWHVRIHALLRDGRLTDARRLAVALQPLVAALFAEPNPAPVKALLAAQGWCEDGLRLPFVPASDALRAKVVELCAALEASTPAVAAA